MHPALWISKTGLDAQQTDIAVISNNLANASTVGFKKSRAQFADLLYQTVSQAGAQSSQNSELPSGLNLGTGVKLVSTQKHFTQGNPVSTDNPLDMTIEGNGFFQILMPDGTTGYSRNGAFTLDESGQMVTANQGLLLQPSITLPQSVKSITIGQDGTISVLEAGQAEPSVVGQVQIADFINPAGLQPIGDNLFTETGASGAPIVGNPDENGLGSILSSALEGSNVNVVEELVDLIETQRTYEMNAKVISAVDEMMQFLNQTV